MNKYWMALAWSLLMAPAMAFEKPSRDEVRRVMSYYLFGDEVVMAEQQLCTVVETEGPNKNQCVTVIEPAVIEEGERAVVWMNFMVPGTLPVHLLVQFHHDEEVLGSRQLTLNPAVRYRTWVSVPTNQVGSWTISVEQDMDEGYVRLGQMEYTVKARAPEQPVQAAE